MPQLPSGRRVAIIPDPLNELLRNGQFPPNVHRVLQIQTPADVVRHIDVAYLVPRAEANGIECNSSMHDSSLPIPEGLVTVSAGFRLADWRANTSDWSEADKEAFVQFINERAQPVIEDWLRDVQQAQALLRATNDRLARLMAAWWDAGCHPAQEEGWDETDVGSPDWDDYDMLAALGQLQRHLANRADLSPHWQVTAKLNAVWAICERELPDIGSLIDPQISVRSCSATLRQAQLLESLPAERRHWFHDQAIIECIELWEALGTDLRKTVPQAYGLIELVALSPEAVRLLDGRPLPHTQ